MDGRRLATYDSLVLISGGSRQFCYIVHSRVLYNGFTKLSVDLVGFIVNNTKKLLFQKVRKYRRRDSHSFPDRVLTFLRPLWLILDGFTTAQRATRLSEKARGPGAGSHASRWRPDLPNPDPGKS